MTEHDDKQVANVDAMANAEPSKGRRRLVKGLIIGTPAIMTVRNGFAQPIASIVDAQQALNIACATFMVASEADNTLINPAALSYNAKYNTVLTLDQCPNAPAPEPAPEPAASQCTRRQIRNGTCSS